MPGEVYLIPTVLHDDEKAFQALPSYITDAIRHCSVFFVENEKTVRRYFKKLWKEMVIDDYQWYTIHKSEETVRTTFIQLLREGKNIGIASEAGCPGIADPGQILIEAAQQLGAIVHPLVGPSSIVLALMASGMNGQCFQFTGYLPIDPSARKKAIRELEEYSQRKNCTQIFIETPYRNNQLIRDILDTCKGDTKLCVAAELTSAMETIRTRTIDQWKKQTPDLHKRPVIFLLQSK